MAVAITTPRHFNSAPEARLATSLAVHWPVRMHIATTRHLIDELERSLARADALVLSGVGEQLADELEVLAAAIRRQARPPSL